MKKRNRFPSVLKEFLEFCQASYEHSRVWTIIGSFVILFAVMDEIRAFTKGYGTFASIWNWITENWNIIMTMFHLTSK